MLNSSLKKGFMTALCALMCLSFTAKASADEFGQGCNQCPTCDPWCMSLCDFNVGLGIFYDTKSENNFIPYLTVLYKCFTAGFGVNGERTDFDNFLVDDVTIVHYDFHIGARYCLCPCLYFTFGASGEYGTTSDSDDVFGDSGRRNPFVAGPYVGFDYHLSPCFLLTAQILPYARVREVVNGFSNQYFEQGMIGVSYLF